MPYSFVLRTRCKPDIVSGIRRRGPQTGPADYCQYASRTEFYCRRYDLWREYCHIAGRICDLGSEPGDDSPESA